MDNHVFEKENEKKKIDIFKSQIQKLEKLAGDVQTSVSNEEISKRVDELKRDLSLLSINSKMKDDFRKNLDSLPKKRKRLEFARQTLYQNGYELIKPIGKGAFGQVYQARVIKDTQESLKIGDDVAVKLIDLEIIRRKDMHSYLQSEIQIHSMLDHPFVLQLYDHFKDEYNHYLILAYCSNGDVRKLMEKKSKLSEEQACQMFSQILQGIVYLHANNIVHRDLKPGNLLLDEHNNIKIADFGLAKQLDDDTDRHNTRCGTPGYMAPEVGDRPYRKEVDIYSLGCLLYNLVIGSAPDKGDSEEELAVKVAHLSSHLQDLLLSMLRENPRKRIKLERILDHPFVKTNSQLFSKFTTYSKDSGFGSSSRTSQSRPSIRENETNPYEAIIRQRRYKPLKDLNGVDPQNNPSENAVPRLGRAPLARPEKRNRPIDALKAKIQALPIYKTNFNDYECSDHTRPNNQENVYHSEECIARQNADICNMHSHNNQNCNGCNSNYDDAFCERRCRSLSPHNSNMCCDNGSLDRNPCSQCGKSLSSCKRSNHPCIHSNNHHTNKQNNCHRSTSPCGRNDAECCSQQDSLCSHNGRCPPNNVCIHEKTCHCHQLRQQKQYYMPDLPDHKNFELNERLVRAKSQGLHMKHQSTDTISKMSAVTKKPEFFSVLHLVESEKYYQNKVFRASILSSQEVCMEFFGKSKYRNKVVKTCIISSDGMHIKVYSFGHHGIQLSEHPPSLPENRHYKYTSDYFADYHYDNLPEKHWTAYLYASKYVKNCKGRTPGVIFYSSKAKAVLMLDFITCEITFYDGTSFVKKFGTVEMINVNGEKKTFNCGGGATNLSSSEKEMWKHASELEKNCHRIPELVDRNEFPPCFPVVCGRKPLHYRKSKLQDNITCTSSTTSTNMGQYHSASASLSNYPISSLDPPRKRAPLKNIQNIPKENVNSSKQHNDMAHRLRI